MLTISLANQTALKEALVAASTMPIGHRQGQHVFNVVYTYLPEIADELRGSEVDPFYKDDRIPLFWAAVVERLDERNH